MPWEERKAVELRTKFVQEAERKSEAFAELCRRYSISRVTGYKWVQRFAQQREAGMKERSRAPRRVPHAMSAATAERIIALRHQHPRWGPRKLRAYLSKRHPASPWPAASSIGELLKREGLSHRRRRRVRTPPYTQPLAHAQAPNQVWCVDFKGWFRCGDGTRCDPLTITDAFSRYLLRVTLVEKTDTPRAQAVFEAAFREFGLPHAIRSDNGAPFASKAPAGLSRLSMWWLRLGIRHERIDPGCPQQNGRHERMHQTLKQEAASPPRANRRRQQRALAEFVWSYNHERPHEALGQRTPAELYVASARVYPSRLPELEYPCDAVHFRRIGSKGELKWRGARIFVSETLAGEMVGLTPIQEQLCDVHYGPVWLGRLDLRAHRFRRDDASRKVSLLKMGAPPPPPRDFSAFPPKGWKL
jgi:putative transposase